MKHDIFLQKKSRKQMLNAVDILWINFLNKSGIKKTGISTGFSLNVGVRRLELPTPCTPCKYASQLRHTPFKFASAKVHFFFNPLAFF